MAQQNSLQPNLPKKPGITLKHIPWVPLVAFVTVAVLSWGYWRQTLLPSAVTIAGGPQNGRYAMLAQEIARELRLRYGTKVTVLETKGSLDNLSLLEEHHVDFALYQSGTRLILKDDDDRQNPEPATFVSNLYPEVLVPVASSAKPSISLETPGNRFWCCNDQRSGDFAATRMLLQHLRIDEADIDLNFVRYKDLGQELQSGDVEFSILCCGLQAPILRDVLKENTGRLLSVPAVDAFARRFPTVARETIPAGYFQVDPPVPAVDFQTVALRAQLLADTEASVRLVEAVTGIVSDSGFQQRLGLSELFAGGTEYATARAEYEIHAGASHVYYPGLKPLLNPDFVEGTEGLRSFVVSLIAAAWLLHRWWKRRRIRGQEHRLDRYIKELLDLERAQMDVDGEGGREESVALQTMLDRVTILRQEALSEFTAHELNEDRAIDCFIEMCHALSDKINAKLTRHTLLKLVNAE